MTLLSPLGAGIAELLADAIVTAITTRIRGIEPAGAVGTDPGDARAPGAYVPFVVLSTLDAPIQASVATSAVALGLRCYAPTYPAAEALYLACAAVFHRKGARIATNRVGIYNSLAMGGPTLGRDPDTQQPYAYGVIELNVSIQSTP